MREGFLLLTYAWEGMSVIDISPMEMLVLPYYNDIVSEVYR